MAEVVDFASRRRKAVTDNMGWSAEDMLLEALEDIRAGRWKPDSVLLIGGTNGETGALHLIDDYRAGCTHERELALIEHAKKRLMDRW